MSSHELDVLWRITIDERLDPERIRVLIAAYLGDVAHVTLDPIEAWSEEVERTIRAKDLLGFFGEGNDVPAWEDLHEGQVYLVGSIEPVRDEDRVVSFHSSSTPPAPYRLDTIPSIKTKQKRLYSDVLSRRGGDHVSA